MLEKVNLLEELAAVAQEVEDVEVLQQYLKSLKKVQRGEKNDLEELKKLKGERKSLKDERDKLYNIISLHLGSPIRSMLTLSNMLLGDAERMDKSAILEFNKHLHTQILGLQKLMGNVMAWASLSVRNYEVKEETVNLAELINQIGVDASEQATRKGVNVNWEVAVADEYKVVADYSMLQVAIENLVENSIKFTAKGGNVFVKVDQDNQGVFVMIKDDGIGMSAAKLKNILNPARKASQRGTANELGLGMGLIVANAYLSLNHSELQIESEQGQGTTMRFYLQLATE